MPAFDTLLIANRGEIAARIIRTARDLGLRTIAVFSEADADGLAVALADEAVCIGPPAASASYLNIEAILAAARRTGAQAIHPGYGFLSENAGFARAVVDAGLIWVGPPPHAIEIMGDKARAKARAIEAGVPTVPGFQDSQDPARLAVEAARIGYPVLLKAVAGGGGRGMRRVTRPEDLADAITSASAEAQNAFANGELMLEKLVEHARHVEIQVFADQHGNVIHLGERDCSAQRRHQKIIEEAPSPAVDAALRARMGAAAVAAAAAIGYVGAGTVEFLLAHDGQFYFLEMNTRLQVEHPVTEAITGFDLVAWQLEVATGRALPVVQDQVELRGHAIEVRFYAEDPAAGFLPQTGEVLAWQPDEREGLRIDHGLHIGVGQGQRIGADYDPMVAKVIAYGANREQARRRLIAGLRGTALLGPTTNKTFLLDLLRHPAFIAGEVTTNFVEHDPSARELGRMPEAPDDEAVALAGLIWLETHRDPRHARPGMPAAWSNSHATRASFELRCGARSWKIAAEQRGASWLISTGTRSPSLRSLSLRVLGHEGVQLRFECDARRRTAHFAWADTGELQLELDAYTWIFAEHRPHESAASSEGSDGTVRAPTMGRVLAVAVALGQVVEAGARLLTLEAMKIESTVLAPIAGTIVELRIAVGDQVDKRQVLVKIETASN